MIKLKDNIITQHNELINSASYDIELESEEELESIFGIITLSDGCEKVIAFTSLCNLQRYKAKFIITEDDLQSLALIKIKLLTLANGGLQKQTNTITIPVDIVKVKQTVKVAVSKEVKDLRLQVAKLEKQIDTLLAGKVLESINIINTDYIRKGMIPVAIDDKGNFVADYPFNNSIVKVNGQEAVNGLVEIDASMIKYKQERSVADTLGFITTAIKALNESIKTLTAQQKSLNDKVDNLLIQEELRQSQGII